MGYALGGNKSFMDMSQTFSGQSISAAGNMKAGYKTETESNPDAGDRLSAGLGMGIAGMQAASSVAGMLATSSALAGGATAAGGAAAGASAGAAAGPWGLAIGALLGIASTFF